MVKLNNDDNGSCKKCRMPSKKASARHAISKICLYIVNIVGGAYSYSSRGGDRRCSVKRDLLRCKKRSTILSKETYCSSSTSASLAAQTFNSTNVFTTCFPKPISPSYVVFRL